MLGRLRIIAGEAPRAARRCTADEDGITVIELVVAVVVLLVVLAALAQTLITALWGNKLARDQVTGNQLANEVIEQLMAAPYPTVAPLGLEPVEGEAATRVRDGIPYEIVVTTSWVDYPCNNTPFPTADMRRDYLRFDVRVTWDPGPGGQRTLDVATYRFPPLADKAPVRLDTPSC
jgi:type II secretory pathway pseudopilin PulG